MLETLSFTERDEFQRRNIAENIIKLLKPEADISPLVIDGAWGTGKSEFSIKLKNLIIEQETESKVVYVDAFKGDHAESPLLLITSAIASILPEEEKQNLIKRSLPAIRFGLKTVLKAGAGWFLRQEASEVAEEFQDAMKKASNAAIDGTIENILEDHMESEKNINSLKSCIEDISNKQKIVIIIDELDRCKPSFSTNIIEKIKHIFDINNVFFILVTNTEQLKASINHIYGYSINSQKYLDKFIKYTITLPDTCLINGHNVCKTSVIYWDHLVGETTLLNKINSLVGSFICDLIQRTNLSLRETQTFSRNLNIFRLLNNNECKSNDPFINMIVVVAVFIHCFGDKEKLKQEITAESISYLADLLNIKEIPYSYERRSQIPEISIIFFGIIKDSITLNERFAPKSDEELKKFTNVYTDYEHLKFWSTTPRELMIKYINQMSFIQ
ncbi:NTPase [Salmonella enterica subsp. enterica serovar Typhimurium]|nr:NTPase [Salmonella enterica subsp. enterica serovar Typhimurium]